MSERNYLIWNCENCSWVSYSTSNIESCPKCGGETFQVVISE